MPPERSAQSPSPREHSSPCTPPAYTTTVCFYVYSLTSARSALIANSCNTAKYWEDPDAFKPGRFLGNYPREAFLPFSGGPRGCIGRGFSETESIAVLTLIISRYRIEVRDEPQFAAETFEQRKTRLLRSKLSVTL